MSQPQKEHVVAMIGLAIVDAVAILLIGISLHEGEVLIPILLGFFCGQAGAIIVW